MDLVESQLRSTRRQLLISSGLIRLEPEARRTVDDALGHPYFISAHRDLAQRAWEFAIGGDEVLRHLPPQSPESHVGEPVVALLAKVDHHIDRAITGYVSYADMLELAQHPEQDGEYAMLGSIIAAIQLVNHWDRETHTRADHIARAGERNAVALGQVRRTIREETRVLFSHIEERLLVELEHIEEGEKYKLFAAKQKRKRELVRAVLDQLGGLHHYRSEGYRAGYDRLARLANPAVRGKAEEAAQRARARQEAA